MFTKLDARTINQEPIENILNILEARWELRIEWNKISLDWHFSTKYRFDRSKNRVWAFNIEMPSWLPFNFIKSFYFSNLTEEDSIIETYKWFKDYYWIHDEFNGQFKMNEKYLKEIEKVAKENRIKQEREEKARLLRRSTFWVKFEKLKNFYSSWIIEYFENRWISNKTLLKNDAKTWIIFHNWKKYHNRLFLPSKVNDEIVGIKMRDIYAKQKEFKSMNMPDSWSWLLYNKEDIIWKDTVYICEWELDKFSLDEAWITNSIWNMMWANTFSEKWFDVLKDAKNLNILYDFDKDSFAWMKWVLKIMKLMPEKNIKFLDLPKLFEERYPADRDILLRDFSDINDLWVIHLSLWYNKDEFKNIIDNNLISRNIDELNEILNWFKIIHDKEKEENIGSFTLSFKSKVKSLDDFRQFKL